ncbi:BTB/POZ domain-containing protein 6-B-like isoform X2 [Ruditapes philippinarum]|nr:BTB/POZ domain-containing protein 6-B-like isoform X2 [Ruditapes philippinarum]
MEGSSQYQIIQGNGGMPVTWQHDKALGECMIELYEKSLWTDVKFKCNGHNEQERIHTHKLVLAARSPVFQAMFFGPCSYDYEDIVLDNTGAETFDIFLRFLYTDNVNLTQDIAVSVLEVAHYYQVTTLVKLCAGFIASCITSDNVLDTLSIARRYDVISLCNACCSFIDQNADKIMDSEGFLKLTEDTLTYILKGDLFFAEEVVIFQNAEKWAQKKLEECNLKQNGQNIRKILGSAFFHLRLPTMTSENLLKCTRKKGYFTMDEYEELVDCMSQTSDTTVNRNSRFPRLPTEEHVYCTDEQSKIISVDRLNTGFQITVSRDVKLKKIELAKINTCVRYGDLFGTDGNTMQVTKDDIFYRYQDFVVRPFQRYPNNYFLVYNLFCRETIPGVQVPISGQLNVTCSKSEEADGNDQNKKETRQNEYLVLEKDLNFISVESTLQDISFEEPLLLVESRSPYTFTINMECKSRYLFNLKTACSEKTCPSSKYSGILVQNVYGEFTGIRSLCFKNISNRE